MYMLNIEVENKQILLGGIWFKYGGTPGGRVVLIWDSKSLGGFGGGIGSGWYEESNDGDVDKFLYRNVNMRYIMV